MEEPGRLGDVGAPYRSRDERRKLAARRLSTERDCWVVTSHAEHGPYVVPVSFLAVKGEVYLATHQRRPTVRNARAEPRVLLVLPGHDDAVWAQGQCAVLGLDEVEPTVMGRYVDKAGWSPAEVDPGFVMLRVSLSSILCSRSPAEDGDRGDLAGGRPGVVVIAPVAATEPCRCDAVRDHARAGGACQLPAAAGAQTGRQAAVWLAGPPLGGALFGLARALPFLVDAVSYTFSVISLLAMRTPFQQQREPDRSSLRWRLAEGFRFLWGHRFMRTCALLFGLANFIGPGVLLAVVVIGKRQGCRAKSARWSRPSAPVCCSARSSRRWSAGSSRFAPCCCWSCGRGSAAPCSWSGRTSTR